MSCIKNVCEGQEDVILQVACVAIGTDPEEVIRYAFACFDEEGSGKIHEDRLSELLTTMGDRFTDAEESVVYGFSHI